MRIGIIGGGSIGLLFASYLSASFPVTIYTRTKEQAENLNRNGIWLKKQHEQKQGQVLACPFEDWNGQEDLTLITVKQYQLHMILQKITESSTTKGSLLFLQNGMGHLEELAKLPNENIFVGSVEHGALRLNEHTVQHNGVGVTKVAVYKGDSTQLQSILSNKLDCFPFVFETDYYQMLLKKLIVNSVINPLTAILQVKNGQLVENPQYRLSLSELYDEVAEVLKLDQKHDYWEHVLSVCYNTAQNQSSMLKDILNHRETEVDAILGFLLKEANLSGRNATLIQTYYYLIKGKEFEGRNQSDD